MPKATATGCQPDANGTSTSATSKFTKLSARIPTTCTRVNTTGRRAEEPVQVEQPRR